MNGLSVESAGAIPLATRLGKDRNRNDTVDRCAPFRDWIRGRGFPAQDLDLVYYGKQGGRVVPVAVLEITRVDDLGFEPPASYFDEIRRRFEGEAQGRVAVAMASLLGVNAYIVAFWSNLERFWLFNLTEGKGWKGLDPDGYWRWVQWLFKSAGVRV